MRLQDYNYELPKSLIAQKPIRPRSTSKLLILKDSIEHKHFYNIIDYLQKDDVLVINETKVIPAKLKGKKSTGARAEIIITGKYKDLYKARIATKNPKPNNKLIFEKGLKAVIKNQIKEIFYLKFNKTNIEDFLKEHGELPTPPYVKRKLEKNQEYQTIYAKKDGSVATPTAGFHFTKELLDKIKKKGIKIAKLTLHVGFGTFIPISSENILNHTMEEEYFEVTKENAEIINNCKGNLIAVGTTTLKTLESTTDEKGNIKPTKGWSNLFITPKHKFKTKIKALITNFHLPKSTLLLLVSGFAGRNKIFKAYKEAIKKKYRFYSFGDAMLLFKENKQPQ